MVSTLSRYCFSYLTHSFLLILSFSLLGCDALNDSKNDSSKQDNVLSSMLSEGNQWVYQDTHEFIGESYSEERVQNVVFTVKSLERISAEGPSKNLIEADAYRIDVEVSGVENTTYFYRQETGEGVFDYLNFSDLNRYYTSLSVGEGAPDMFYQYKSLKFPLKIGEEWDYRFDTKKTVEDFVMVTLPAVDFEVYEAYVITSETKTGLRCTEYVHESIGLIKKTCTVEGIPRSSFRNPSSNIDLINDGVVVEKTGEMTYRFERVLQLFIIK